MGVHSIRKAAPLSPELAKVATDLAAAGEKTMASEAWAEAVRHGGARAAQAFIGRGGWQTGDSVFDLALTSLVRLEEGDETEVNDILAVAKGDALTAWTMRRDHARTMRARLAAACYVQSFGSAAAAYDAVHQPGYNDEFERAVCQELRTMRYQEQVKANAAKAALYLASAA